MKRAIVKALNETKRMMLRMQKTRLRIAIGWLFRPYGKLKNRMLIEPVPVQEIESRGQNVMILISPIGTAHRTGDVFLFRERSLQQWRRQNQPTHSPDNGFDCT